MGKKDAGPDDTVRTNVSVRPHPCLGCVTRASTLLTLVHTHTHTQTCNSEIKDFITRRHIFITISDCALR